MFLFSSEIRGTCPSGESAHPSFLSSHDDSFAPGWTRAVICPGGAPAPLPDTFSPLPRSYLSTSPQPGNAWNAVYSQVHRTFLPTLEVFPSHAAWFINTDTQHLGNLSVSTISSLNGCTKMAWLGKTPPLWEKKYESFHLRTDDILWNESINKSAITWMLLRLSCQPFICILIHPEKSQGGGLCSRLFLHTYNWKQQQIHERLSNSLDEYNSRKRG